MESPFSWHMAASLARMYSEHPLPSVCVCVCVCKTKKNEIISDISILFLYVWFPEPCITVPSDS